MEASMQGMTISFINYTKAPNKSASVVTAMGQVFQKNTFDGTVGKETVQGKTTTLEGADLEELKASSKMFGDIDYNASGSTFELLGVELIDGKDAYKIEETKSNGDKQSEWYDVATSLKVKTMQISEAPEAMGGGTFAAVTLYYDYKVIGGINYAHKINQSAGPQVFDMNVVTIEHNTKLGDEVFQ